MLKHSKFSQAIFSIIVIFTLTLSGVSPSAAQAQADGDGLQRLVNAETGRLSFIRPESGRALAASRALGTFFRPQDPAMALATRYAPEFGVKDPGRDLSVMKTDRSDDEHITAHFQQNYNDVPVMGGELIVNTNGDGDLYSINGEVSPNLSLQTQPTIDARQAAVTALTLTAKWYQVSAEEFAVSAPELWIFDESLLQPSTRPVELVWRMEVTPREFGLPVRELVLVNAERGSISLHFNQVDTAWHESASSTISMLASSPAIDAGNPVACPSDNQRGVAPPVGTKCDLGVYQGSVAWVLSSLVQTYTANNGTSLPGTFLCNQSQPNCTSGANPHADGAHKYAIGTYDLYATKHLRDSIDNNGMTIVSTTHYYSGYANAFWNGAQMVYGDAYGFPLADDVVAHELTHGVTQYESNLFYYYQSGAINESFSDLWGEYYDQTNGQGNDAAGVKWLMGEDVSGMGAIRSMSNPPAYGDPDKMSSPSYYEGTDDSGGVHINSGVNNKAVYLMVDGGTFNTKTVTALGWDKTAAIYYEAQTNLLTSGADYSDLYYALQQACNKLVGQYGIVAGNCVEVKDAVDAVEMYGQPAANFNTDAPICTTVGTYPNYVLQDDLEYGSANWAFTAGPGYNRWQIDSPYGPYAQSGLHSLYADDYPDTTTDTRAQLVAFVVPANAFLHFAHAYGFEHLVYSGTTYYFDGGVLEYSINGGATWVDASPLFTHNGYKGTIATNWDNPLKGRTAFVGDSHGYISTRLNLASLAGKTVVFRWRMGLDYVGYNWGWWVDNVKVYTCTTNINISGNVGAGGVILNYMNGTLKTVTSQPNGDYSIPVPPGWSGTITPTHPCFMFSPADLTFNNVTGNLTGQNFTPTLNIGAGCADVDILIGGLLKASYAIPDGDLAVSKHAGLLDGPVQVVSTNSENLVTSQRVTSGDSYNELMGMPINQFSTEYWFSYYNHGYPNVAGSNMRTWILVGNPSTSQTATVNIYIGGNLMSGSPFSIPPGSRVTPRWIGLQGGPVRVVGDIPIFASERMFTSNNNAFSESLGYAIEDFTTEYWFPWYDSVNMDTSILVGNTSASQTATVDIYIGAAKKGTYNIPPNTTLSQKYPNVVDGPLRVVSTNGIDIVTSENAVSGPGKSFSDVMGYPFDQFTNEYWFPYYDHGYPNVAGSNMRTWILVGNPSASQTATVNIYIDGVLTSDSPFSIPPGSRVTPRWISLQGGPVRVVSDIPVFASERVFTVPNNVFNEMFGYPLDQMVTEYWYPWYDSVNMNNDILIAQP